MDRMLTDRLVALVEDGAVIHLHHDDPRYDDTRTYLRAGPGERAGYLMIAGPHHGTTKLGPKQLAAFIAMDLDQGWHTR